MTRVRVRAGERVCEGVRGTISENTSVNVSGKGTRVAMMMPVALCEGISWDESV